MIADRAKCKQASYEHNWSEIELKSERDRYSRARARDVTSIRSEIKRELLLQ